MIGAPGSTHRIGFYLLPEFSLLAFSAALDPLRMANRLAGKVLYEWQLISDNAAPVASSCDVLVTPDHGLPTRERYDAVFVCGGDNIHRVDGNACIGWLRQLDRRDVVIGALCTGSYVLACAGLLNGYRCTIHWENLAAIRERFPHLIFSAELYEMDGRRYTCTGGNAPMDMMLAEIRSVHGAGLASGIAAQFMCERIRDRNDRQRVPLTQRIGAGQPRLAEAVALMEANIEEPMTLDELSHRLKP